MYVGKAKINILYPQCKFYIKKADDFDELPVCIIATIIIVAAKPGQYPAISNIVWTEFRPSLCQQIKIKFWKVIKKIMALTVCICSNEHSVFNQHFRGNGKTGSNADNPQCPSKHPHQLNYLFSREYCSTKFICLAKNECWLFICFCYAMFLCT